MNILTFKRCESDHYDSPPFEVVARNVAYVTKEYDYDYIYMFWTANLQDAPELMTTIVMISGEKLYVAESVNTVKRRLRCCDA